MGSTIKYLVVCIFAMVSLTMAQIYAQTPAIAAEAVELCQAKKFQEALTSIQKGIDDPQDSKHPYTWFVKGFIHKEAYKCDEMYQRSSQHREIAVKCFEKSLQLDDKREFVAQTHVALKYLASTYFNDAMLASREFDLASPEEYITYFHTFRRLMRMVDPVTDLSPFEHDLLKSAGQRYFEIWQLDTDQDGPANQAAAKFLEALGHDSTDCHIYYNLGVVYYNRAVFKYRSLNVDTEMDELFTIQTESVGLLQKALQVFTNGQRICPEDGDILKGLLYINKAFENEKNVEYFKSEIERLIDEGKIKKPED